MAAETRVMREQKVLRCYLTNVEKLDRGQRVAELTYTIDGLEAEKKAEADRYKGKISEAEGLRKQLSGVLRDGYEMRPVECRLEFHYDTGRVWTIREDTGELIDDREMKEEERFRQGRLFHEGETPRRSAESIGREALERGGPTILPAEEPAQPDTPAQGAGEADDPTTAHTEEQEEAAGDPTSAGEAASSGDEDAAEENIYSHADPSFPPDLEWLVHCSVSDVNFRNALARATEEDLRAALASPEARRTLSRAVAIKRELRRRGLSADEPHEPTQQEREEMLAEEEEDWGPHNDSAVPCATCHHIEMVHGDGRNGGSDACMAIDCKCRHFVPPDPLGIDDVDPQAEKGVEPCDSAS